MGNFLSDCAALEVDILLSVCGAVDVVEDLLLSECPAVVVDAAAVLDEDEGTPEVLSGATLTPTTSLKNALFVTVFIMSSRTSGTASRLSDAAAVAAAMDAVDARDSTLPV